MKQKYKKKKKIEKFSLCKSLGIYGTDYCNFYRMLVSYSKVIYKDRDDIVIY